MDGDLRRSGRRRTANQRYVNDVSHLLESPDSENGETSPKNGADDGHASEFDGATERASASDASPPDQQDDAPSSEESQADGGGSSNEEHLGSRKAPRVDRRRLRKATEKPPDSQHARGFAGGLPKLSKTWEIARTLVGSNSKEQELFASKLDRWAEDGVFPTRNHMSQPAMEDEDAMTGSWRWYTHNGGRERFEQLQTTRALSHDKGHQYYPSRQPAHKAVLGPSWQERLYHLVLDEALHLADTWKAAPMSTSDESPDTTSALESNGWILNLGAKIQSISWASPLHDHHRQFLAVALDHPNPHGERIATAFEPSVAFKSCIQVWSFQSQMVDNASDTFDPHHPPVLVHVICTEWGMCKEIKWCPFPIAETEAGPQVNLGLLASIWSDGYVRVLDVTVPSNKSSDDLCVNYETAAFAARPPDTICSSASWSSPSDLMVGCANGRIAAWNIAKATKEQLPFKNTNEAGQLNKSKHTGSSGLQVPLPYLYHQLHDTYILSVEHCVPHFPWLLISLSTDGMYRLCDLRNPDFDTMESRRYRVYPVGFDYCPQMFAAITADGYNGATLRPLRHFLPDLVVTYCNARISAIACGRAHPHSLVGLVDGTVMAFNIAPQIFRDKKSRKRWGTVWFKHEWRPEEGLVGYELTSNGDTNGNSAPEALDSRIGQMNSDALRKGVSRITEAFEPYIYGQRSQATSSKKRSSAGQMGAPPWETIFEEPSAITQLKWNPNPRCGGWAAAGMGSGLLRVEDLAI